MSAIRFDIDQWQAWAPGRTCQADWLRWAQSGDWEDDPQAQPDASFLPAMQRRRLSRLARMVFAVAHPLAEGQPPMPLVYASRHGETTRNFALLSDLANEQPLSPTQFSLSVHNAIVGLWSIFQGDCSEMTALAAEGDGLEHAMLEATLLLNEGAPAVLLVIAEETPPEAYRPWIDDASIPYALALRLTAGDSWQLQLQPADETAAQLPQVHALQLIRALLGGHPQFTHHWKTRKWNWQRTR
ncbi:beta-ketoacyl synthase chain length factor [Pseudomonas stutzeri]|uniref:3-oxoacyl-ACP synthase n=1 Tax=Stutzerimonas stutzeri TaxID=316 RepID=A0A2N8RXW6_STUST|nr:beta-ketoacyl synthase chain length factor [Stutzerimonas stutzeri]MCQ4296197.1 beta-ketoacyl synthase chain length factor [Stutzerimonas stutzeri]PNF79216.1 3-oxoacyl-ACP synthase [Stutzerimonas stutzeri]